MPRTPRPAGVIGLLLDGYDFIGRQCDRRHRDVFASRFGPLPVICMRGRAAGEQFYSDRFQRAGAMPGRVRKTLLGVGGVQGLDGPAHHHRKAMFLSLMTPEALGELTATAAQGWSRAIDRWERRDEPVVLLDAAGEILCRAVHDWAGVPLDEVDVAARARELHDLIDTPARLGPPHWRGRLARRRADRRAAQLVAAVRAGTVEAPEDRALHVIATHRDHRGELLPPEIAAVELINVLRPTVAIDRFIVFAALALVEHPEWRERLRRDDCALDRFVQEVRRYYPFFPAAAAKVRTPFDWNGVHFPAGRLVLFDLYGTDHDPAIWPNPDRFDPERFVDRDLGPSDLVAQGGGDHADGHRCAGEWLTIDQMRLATRVLTRDIRYAVPAQDLRVSRRRFPTQPNSGLVISDIRRIG